MSFNSKYTGAQIEELFGKIPIANDIWHTGNFNPSNYLPLSGGTLTDGLTISAGNLIVSGSDTVTNSLYPTKDNQYTLGNSSRYWSDIYTKLINGGTPWTSANDGSSSGLDADLLDGKHLYDILASNVASATKLQTARNIWGQSFDGTGNVDGDFTQTKEGAYGGAYSDNSFYIYNRVTSDVQGRAGALRWAFNNYSVFKRLDVIGENGGTTTIIASFLDNGNVGMGTPNPGYKLDVNGDIHASGSITQNSDINSKIISKDILLSLDVIAEAPLFEFTYKSDKDKRIHVGTSAQYWVEKNNWFCKKQGNGYYDMEIQNLALASAISIAKEFKKYKEETESTISSMKNKIEELKQIILNMNK